MLKKLFEELYFYLDEELTKSAMQLLDVEVLLKLSINHSDYLEVIKDKGNPTLGDIAQVLEVSKPSVTIMINKLIQQGLVKKIQSQDDKRVVYVELTDLGRDLVDLQLNVFRKFASDLEEALEVEEVENLVGLFSKGLKRIKGK